MDGINATPSCLPLQGEVSRFAGRDGRGLSRSPLTSPSEEQIYVYHDCSEDRKHAEDDRFVPNVPPGVDLSIFRVRGFVADRHLSANREPGVAIPPAIVILTLDC